MRRKYWWSAAVTAAALVGAVGAPAAYACYLPDPPGHSATAGQHGGHSGPGGQPVTAKDVGWFDWGRCAYPPQGMPSVWVHAGGTSGHARTVRISGWMKLNGCGYEQFPAGLYRRVIEHGRSHWERVATTTTGKRGSLSFCVSVDRPTTFRVMTAGADGLAPAWSNTQFVETPGHH